MQDRPAGTPPASEDVTPAYDGGFPDKGSVCRGRCCREWFWLVSKPGIKTLYKYSQEDGIGVKWLASLTEYPEKVAAPFVTDCMIATDEMVASFWE